MNLEPQSSDDIRGIPSLACYLLLSAMVGRRTDHEDFPCT